MKTNEERLNWMIRRAADKDGMREWINTLTPENVDDLCKSRGVMEMNPIDYYGDKYETSYRNGWKDFCAKYNII